VVLTTYGTLRNDAVYLKDIEFDYLILDESQAIKRLPPANPPRQPACCTGGQSPGAVGHAGAESSGRFVESLRISQPRNASAPRPCWSGATARQGRWIRHTKLVLTKALRPFILRRTRSRSPKILPAQARTDDLLRALDTPSARATHELKSINRKNS